MYDPYTFWTTNEKFWLLFNSQNRKWDLWPQSLLHLNYHEAMYNQSWGRAGCDQRGRNQSGAGVQKKRWVCWNFQHHTKTALTKNKHNVIRSQTESKILPLASRSSNGHCGQPKQRGRRQAQSSHGKDVHRTAIVLSELGSWVSMISKTITLGQLVSLCNKPLCQLLAYLLQQEKYTTDA